MIPIIVHQLRASDYPLFIWDGLKLRLTSAIVGRAGMLRLFTLFTMLLPATTFTLVANAPTRALVRMVASVSSEQPMETCPRAPCGPTAVTRVPVWATTETPAASVLAAATAVAELHAHCDLLHVGWNDMRIVFW